MAKHVLSASVTDALPLSLVHPYAALPDDAPLLIGRALEAPLWRLTEAEAVDLIAGMSRAGLLQLAAHTLALVAERDGRPGYENPNLNALLLAAIVTNGLLFAGPCAVFGEG
ncbi:hypothetical protein IAI18_07605 [Acetobacteraceae bacterium H6797]|nr:hypothetical protein [Acetobacteraceae bacterium H6797]